MKGGVQRNTRGPVVGKSLFIENDYPTEAPLITTVKERAGSTIRAQRKEEPVVEKIEPDAAAEVATELTDEDMYKSIPIHELNVEYPMPFLQVPITEMPVNEYNNEASWTYNSLLERGRWYLETFPEKFSMWDPEDSDSIPKKEDCFGFLFTLSEGAVAFEVATLDDPLKLLYFKIMYENLNSTYEPIYVLAKDKAYNLSASQFKEAFPLHFDDGEASSENKNLAEN